MKQDKTSTFVFLPHTKRTNFFSFFVKSRSWQERKTEMHVLALLSACINEHYYVNFNGETLSHASLKMCPVYSNFKHLSGCRKLWWLQPWCLVFFYHVTENCRKEKHVLLSLLQHHQFSLAPCIWSQSSKVRRKLCRCDSFMFRNRSQKVPSSLINPELALTTLAALNQCDYVI